MYPVRFINDSYGGYCSSNSCGNKVCSSRISSSNTCSSSSCSSSDEYSRMAMTSSSSSSSIHSSISYSSNGCLCRLSSAALSEFTGLVKGYKLFCIIVEVLCTVKTEIVHF